jgi:hypothetical protein
MTAAAASTQGNQTIPDLDLRGAGSAAGLLSVFVLERGKGSLSNFAINCFFESGEGLKFGRA